MDKMINITIGNTVVTVRVLPGESISRQAMRRMKKTIKLLKSKTARSSTFQRE
jgi:hypothetical protein